MRLAAAIADVRAAEARIAAELDAVAARHPGEHDVVHVARALAGLAEANLAALAPHAARHGAAGDPGPAAGDPAPAAPDPALALLRDLRRLHLRYAEASIDWVLLGQGAQAARDAALLDAVTAAHARTLRGLAWTVTRLKEAAPQALTS
ncbi:MAG: hypothetical protein IRZ32_04305 [Solirubrobacteraceae bacterium]|nr:hypothetical protein [Solirubrobacteraceae bacterium]